MKKTFQANINGKVFHIDEDAYTLLQNYFSQLRATFPGQEGSEIVGDIECRISELFDERIAKGANVIVIEDVNNVIETMGRPEQLQDEAEFKTTGQCGSNPTGNRPAGCPPPPPVHKKLYRDVRHKVFGGVIAGIAQYTGWDVTVMRILVVLLTILPLPFFEINFGTWVLIYLIAWMVIPVARTPRQILEMQGQPVTIDKVGQTVINNSVPPVAPVPSENPNTFSSFLNTLFSIFAKIILAFFGLFSGLVALGMIIAAVAVLSAMIATSFELATFVEPFDIDCYTGWGMICAFMAVAIPGIAIFWAACSVIFRIKGASKTLIIIGLVLEILFVSGALIIANVAPVPEDMAIASIYSFAPASLVSPMLS